METNFEQQSHEQITAPVVVSEAANQYSETAKVFHNRVTGKRYGRLNFINAYMIIMGVFFIPYLFSGLLIAYGLSQDEMVLSVVGGFLYFCCAVVSVFFNIRIAVIRLHDLNQSGLVVLPIIFVPLLIVIISFACMVFAETSYNERFMVAGMITYGLASLVIVAVMILLMAVPGTKGANRFGLPTKQGSWIGLIVMCSIMGLSLLLIFVSVVAMSGAMFMLY